MGGCVCELQSLFQVHTVFQVYSKLLLSAGLSWDFCAHAQPPSQEDVPGVHPGRQGLSHVQAFPVKFLAGPFVCQASQLRSLLRIAGPQVFVVSFQF